MTAADATLLLLAVLPICLWVAWSDLAFMLIPNAAVAALVLIYLCLGLVLLPPDVWAWRWINLPVTLLLSLGLYATGQMGAGDAKFLAAAAPFVWWGDWPLVCLLLSGTMLLCWALHRIAGRTPLRRLVPGWRSWSVGNRFPLGVPLALTLALYLLLVAMGD
ncbi:prepilin peptidase [Pseudoroseicyclus aestuarii]|uniref:Prepilin peptidase CpaA n=1 Tax=Pseudoroseicyclus aestuarii TaxID=1795041 RepID=A0A318SX51_9RHOB|nr:prepilin peptidase [Pseudoroseicyclus aestuarii]PYE84976.1 prepilin peptidase CpaA [Pseudoroseicyclus aestuarii]